MKNSELIEELRKLPLDAEVNADITVKSGFYDVPVRHARGTVYYVQYLAFVPDHGITLIVK